MDMYNNTLDLERFAARRAQPLHKKLKNLYKQNRGFQSQNRKLKVELQHFKDELAQRNLNVLVEASIEREEPIKKKSTPYSQEYHPCKRKTCCYVRRKLSFNKEEC
jgi:dsDNA-specific endonuclease/ATPase MutS2